MGKRESVLSIFKQNLLPLSLGVLGLIFFAYGLISLLGQSEKESSLVIESNSEAKSEILIAADIQGAVVKPGVYQLAQGSRIKDLLVIAGGLSSDADRVWVSKNLNLAQKISDESKIFIPKEGEAESITTSSGSTNKSGLININSASSSELESLPRIGVVTAGKIIDGRPYSSIDDLKTKEIVSDSVFEEIKDKVSVF